MRIAERSSTARPAARPYTCTSARCARRRPSPWPATRWKRRRRRGVVTPSFFAPRTGSCTGTTRPFPAPCRTTFPCTCTTFRSAPPMTSSPASSGACRKLPKRRRHQVLPAGSASHGRVPAHPRRILRHARHGPPSPAASGHGLRRNGLRRIQRVSELFTAVYQAWLTATSPKRAACRRSPRKPATCSKAGRTCRTSKSGSRTAAWTRARCVPRCWICRRQEAKHWSPPSKRRKAAGRRAC